MKLHLKKITYEDLNSRQKENYNFHKVSALLADYGYSTIRLTDDWMGADFIAQHIGGDIPILVQLKGRVTFDRKYEKKNLYICFFDGHDCYLYPHDEILGKILMDIGETDSWKVNGGYSWPTLSKKLKTLLEDYRI